MNRTDGREEAIMNRERGNIGAAALVISAIVVVAIVIFGGWRLGWWFEEQNVEQRTRIDQERSGTQLALRTRAEGLLADIETTDPDNVAARKALENQACGLIGRITDQFQTEDLVAFEQENC